MTTRYAVWIEVEEITDEGTPNENYQTLDVPFGSSAGFDTYEEAIAFAKRMHEAVDGVPE